MKTHITETIQKILPILLALIAAVVLLSTPSRAPSETPPPSTTEATQSEPAPTEDAMSTVEEILTRRPLDETATAHCVYDAALHSSLELTGADRASPAHALARLCADREMNPIAAFWHLAEEGLYRKSPEIANHLAAPAVHSPAVPKKEYPYTTEGAREFLTELLALAFSTKDGLPLNTVEQISWTEQEDCCYTYYVCYSPETAHFLCFYLRGGETITDVEFQLLNLRYADGKAESLTRLDQLGDRQAAALMAAAELLLTGESRAAQGRIPLGYELSGCTVTIERFSIVGSGDIGTLTNYRIRK